MTVPAAPGWGNMPVRPPYECGGDVRVFGSFGWACECHGGPRAVYDWGMGWHVVSPADWCPRRRAVTRRLGDEESAADGERGEVSRVVVGDVPPPAELEMPNDMAKLLTRCWPICAAAGTVGAGMPRLTWSLYQRTRRRCGGCDTFGRTHTAACPIAHPPPDAPEPARKTRDVQVLAETLALRAWPVGVVIWGRDVGGNWKAAEAFVLEDHGGVERQGIERFKQLLTMREKDPWMTERKAG